MDELLLEVVGGNGAYVSEAYAASFFRKNTPK